MYWYGRVYSMMSFGLLLSSSFVKAQDWPQWLGPNRDASASGFVAPATWPNSLVKSWELSVGNGVATPALVGDKIITFGRTGSSEVIRCLLSTSGKQLWKYEYAAQPATGAASGFPGPRSSPAVAEGKLVALGVSGTITCIDLETGNLVWQKQEFKGSVPRFFTSSSPLIVDGVCIVQVGSENKGATIALALDNGDVKWKWEGDGTAYASPTSMTIDGIKYLIAETATKIVGLNISDGSKQWEIPYPLSGGRGGYNASTPVVSGQTMIFAGSNRGVKAIRLKRNGSDIVVEDLWTNTDNSLIYNTPVLVKGFVYGITSNDAVFAINMETGKTAWSKQLPDRARLRGYGTLVNAGDVIFAMNPASQLIAIEANGDSFKQLASYKVSGGETFAIPISSGNRFYIKDQELLIAWSIE